MYLEMIRPKLDITVRFRCPRCRKINVTDKNVTEKNAQSDPRNLERSVQKSNIFWKVIDWEVIYFIF